VSVSELLIFPFSRLPLLLKLGAALGYVRTFFCSHFLLFYLCHWSCCQAVLLEQKVHYSHHINRCRFTTFITKSISWKWPNTYIFTPRQNSLNRKWNWMCRGDYSPACEIRDQGYWFFSPSQDWPSAYFVLRGRMTVTSRGWRWCVQCGRKVARNILLKTRKRANRKHICLCFYWHHWQISLLIAVDTNFFCSLFCAAVLNRFPCFQLVSFLTDHTFTKYNMIHYRNTLLLFKRAPAFLFKRAPHVTRYYYVTLHFTGYDDHLPSVCKW